MRELAIVGAVTLLDQWTKHWVRQHFGGGGLEVVIPGFFELHLVRNTGAAWGMLAGKGLFLIGFSLAMLVLLIVQRRRLFGALPLGRLAWGLLVAGILGNLIDRLLLGHVIDFLNFHVRDAYFPAFNVADSAICTGVGLYLLGSFRLERQGRRAAAAAAPSD